MTSILLIDDDPLQHAVARKMLGADRDGSYGLEGVTTYDEGLARMVGNSHDAYLVDVYLGADSGLALIREARLRGCHGPIVVITGSLELGADLEALQAGADDVLVKSRVDAYALTKAIRYAIQRNRAEKLIHAQQAQLAQNLKLSALGEMAGGIAHEINNPLAILAGRAEQLRRMLDQPDFDREQAQAVVGKVTATVGRIARIVRTLRGICRSEGASQVERAPVNTLVQDALELCQAKLRHSGVRLEMSDIDPGLVVPCRPSEIQQVLLNLISNSLDAIAAREDRWVRVTVDGRPDHVEIGLEDSGDGIPKSMHDRIMEPFFTTKRDGTGLGLSISRKIVEGHQGYLKVDDGAVHTRFVIGLPRDKYQERAV